MDFGTIGIAATIAGAASTAYGTVQRAQADTLRGQEMARSAAVEQQNQQIQEQQYRTAAAEKEAQRTRDLTSQLETVQAMRAGRGVGAGSPTAMALFDNAITTSERDTNIEKTNYLTKADTARRSGILAGERVGTSLLSGYLGSQADYASGVSSIASSGFNLARTYR